jgi:RNA polymerase sigma factor (sigma-70 family)
MEESTELLARFEEHRPRLAAMATRMLGSRLEADDAVQEAWIRFSRTDTTVIENLGAWLTTVLSRVCLNALQSRHGRADSPLDVDLAEAPVAEPGPEAEALLADSIGLALLVVLDSLSPPERVAFVLHDIFAVPFEEIAPIVGRNATATRQLASRARRRAQSAGGRRGDPDKLRNSRLVEAFLVAARHGDFAALVGLLDPQAVFHADEAAAAISGPRDARGAEAIAAFSMRARGAHAVLADGMPAAAWMPRGKLRVVLLFTFSGDRVTSIEAVADPGRLARFDLVVAEEVEV